MVTLADVQRFISNNLGFASASSAQTGLPADYILGQAANETGYGTSYSARARNNYFGISPGGNLATYGSPADSFSAFSSLINGRYNTSALGNSPYDIASGLQSQGYATDPSYGSKVAGTTSVIDQALHAMGLDSFIGSGGGGSDPTKPAPIDKSKLGHGDAITNWLDQIGPSVVFVVIGVIVLIIGLYVLAVRSGVAPPPSQIARTAATAAV